MKEHKFRDAPGKPANAMLRTARADTRASTTPLIQCRALAEPSPRTAQLRERAAQCERKPNRTGLQDRLEASVGMPVAQADAAKNHLAEDRMRRMQACFAKSLTTVKNEGYPLQFSNIGQVTLKQ
jgi:hypothetical protein